MVGLFGWLGWWLFDVGVMELWLSEVIKRFGVVVGLEWCGLN